MYTTGRARVLSLLRRDLHAGSHIRRSKLMSDLKGLYHSPEGPGHTHNFVTTRDCPHHRPDNAGNRNGVDAHLRTREAATLAFSKNGRSPSGLVRRPGSYDDLGDKLLWC